CTLQAFPFTAVPAQYVKLKVVDNYGGTQVRLQTLQVSSPQAGGTRAWFQDLSTDRDGDALSYSWTVGDGGTSTERDPVHQYAAPGVYDVTLTTRDPGGLSSSRTISYHAFAPPVADFTFTPVSPAEGQTTTFTSTATGGGGTVVKWDWSFSDGWTTTLTN